MNRSRTTVWRCPTIDKPYKSSYRLDERMGGSGYVVACVSLGLMLLFGGCIGSATKATPLGTGADEPVSSTFVEAEPGVLVAENRGLLRGTVYNDASLGVPGARIAILQTSLFAISDAAGAFRIDNVTLGDHVVRVEIQGYQAAENQTRIMGGKVSQVDFYLVPLERTGAGYRPHLHDYWGAQTEITIMDADQDFTKPETTSTVGGSTPYQVNAMLVYPNQNNTAGDMRIRIPGDADPPALIYPGTKEIRVTITWTQSQSTVQKVGLKYIAPNTPSNQVNVLGRNPSGAPWKIAVTPEMTDTGHQAFTLWTFYMYPFQDPLVDGANWRPGAILGTFHVTIVVVKGELGPEPSHEDFWAGKDEIVIMDGTSGTSCNSAYRMAERGSNPCQLRPPRIVPPGTQKLQVTFTWKYAVQDAVAANDLQLQWRTAAQNPWTTKVTDWGYAEPKASGVQTRTYEITLKPGETDAFYQKRSLWSFTSVVKGHEKDEQEYEPRAHTITLRVLAIKDPTFDASK
jgi:hypothetical protein